MPGSIAKKLGKTQETEPTPPPAPSSLKTETPDDQFVECLWCDHKVRKGSRLPVCKSCERIALETSHDSPREVLSLLFELSRTVGEYLRWANENTPMGRMQLENLNTRARHLLNTTYPLTLTKDGLALSSFQDLLTEALKVWMREQAKNHDGDMTMLFAEIMNTFKPPQCNFAISQLEHMPTGYLVIEVGMLQKVLGVAPPNVGHHDRVSIELINLFAMLDPEYAGRLACTLKEDPYAKDKSTAE